MSASPSSRPSDVAARQVEQIVLAAQEAADQIRNQAEAELEALRREAREEGESLRDEARRQAETELNRARKDAIMLSEDARRDAELIVGEAQAQSDELREKTQRAVKGRVAAAEVAAAEVLDEAKALSAGLNQLARSLSDKAERILRDVQAAHTRMQADLRIGPSQEEPRTSRSEERHTPASQRASGETGAVTPSRQRANPFDELDVPAWER
jgi:cell division septum initiation protein DivIVA